MDAKMKMRIARAKRTALGRFFCRLAGDNAGAVMMEYVVLGVLVVAAVVGLVVAFGDTLGEGFKVMTTAIFKPHQADEQSTEGSGVSDESVEQGDGEHKTIVNRQ